MRKPSEISKIDVSVSNLVVMDDTAIMVFGDVFVANERVKGLVEKNHDGTLVHETIHVRQAQSLGDSFPRFYLEYALRYLKSIVLMVYGFWMPYYLNPFEMEAYAFDGDESHVASGACDDWKVFDKMSWKEKVKIAKEFKKTSLSRREFFKNVYFNLLIDKADIYDKVGLLGRLIGKVKNLM